jgi:hypothetical protein
MYITKIFVNPYVRGGLILAAWRDTHLSGSGKLADNPLIAADNAPISIARFRKAMMEDG